MAALDAAVAGHKSHPSHESDHSPRTRPGVLDLVQGSCRLVGPCAKLDALRPHLRSMLCVPLWEAPVPLASYVPPNPGRFGIEVQAFIGSARDGRVDSFDF